MDEKKTLERQILAFFLRGGSLTVLYCWKKFHTTELRHFVSIYRKHYCIPVRSRREKNTNDNGTHNVYWINDNMLSILKSKDWVKELIS